MPLLLITAAAAWFMTGLGWMVQAVHYPLFARVGADGWAAYHAEHSRRITPIVLPVMSVELGGALLVALTRPEDVPAVLTVGALAAALSTWVVTGLGAVPAHGRLSGAFDPAAHRRLLRADRLRTAGWSAHGVLAAVLVAGTAG
ncbi:MAG: hypothetical protein JWP18_105 [Solirubrobacterales bacterium]|nr:hypothetical protein [Solirubrobacterales bacterium]